MSPTFAELPLRSQTIEALHAHGFLAPFAIQEMVLPIALADGDVADPAKRSAAVVAHRHVLNEAVESENLVAALSPVGDGLLQVTKLS
jgi:hypothetical protein